MNQQQTTPTEIWSPIEWPANLLDFNRGDTQIFTKQQTIYHIFDAEGHLLDDKSQKKIKLNFQMGWAILIQLKADGLNQVGKFAPNWKAIRATDIMQNDLINRNN